MCFVETIFDSKVNKECYEFGEESLEIEQDIKDYIKFNLSIPKIITADKIIDNNIIISEINSQIPILKKIYCNSMTKWINYSNKKITKKDLIIVQDDNFCPFISNNITINKCFKGLLFKDFVSEGR